MTPKGQVTEFTLPVSGKYEAIVSGPDGNLWIAVNHAGATPGLHRRSDRACLDQWRSDRVSYSSGAGITGLIARRDGTLSFTERWVTGGSTYIGRITTAGQITETSLSLKK